MGGGETESVCKKKLFQKLVTRWDFFKNQLLVAADLWWSKNTSNSVKAADVHHDHHPTTSSEVAKMCKDPGHARDRMLQKSFVVSPICVYRKCMIFPWCVLLIKHTCKQIWLPNAFSYSTSCKRSSPLHLLAAGAVHLEVPFGGRLVGAMTVPSSTFQLNVG